MQDASMQLEETTPVPAEQPVTVTSTLAETEMYAYLLVLTYTIDQSKSQQVGPHG